MGKRNQSTNATQARRRTRWLTAAVLVSAVAAGMYWNPAAAVGLGELKLNSARYQAFDAEIKLVSPTPEEMASIKVSMASNARFARYGIDRPAYLDDFEFTVVPDRDGGMVIKVTSSSLVTEPVVDLLVEVQFGRGILLREYNVVLDPEFIRSKPVPTTAQVMGLGVLKVSSARYHPFDAEIEVFPVTTLEFVGQVSLASSAVFARYKIDRPAYLSDFAFAFGRDRVGRSVIKVTSTSAITEPVVDLLVEVKSDRGILLREYKVVLHPELLSKPAHTAPITLPQ